MVPKLARVRVVRGLARRAPAASVLASVVAGALAGALGVAPDAVGAPNDPSFDRQWGLRVIGAEEAWARGTGAGVTIAIVDSGVDLAHEDLATQIEAHVSCVGSDGDPRSCGGTGTDDNGHGTHVAGIAAAATGNGKGVAGTAPGARLLAVKVLENDDATGEAVGTIRDIEAGVRWAVDRGADVVNLSLGEVTNVIGQVLGSSLDGAITYAWNHGSIPVVAAGNEFLFSAAYGDLPALVVTATDPDDNQASYASDVGDARWGIAAPGGDGPPTERRILSTYWRQGKSNSYAWLEGTSMAVPHVAGAAAILRSLGLSPRQTVDRLLATARDLGAPGYDARYGAGRLDLAAATAGLKPAPGAGNDEGSDSVPPPPVSKRSTAPKPGPGKAPAAPPVTVRSESGSPSEAADTSPPSDTGGPKAPPSSPARTPPERRVTGGGAEPGAESASPPDDGGTPVALGLVAAMVGLAGAGWLLARLRRAARGHP